MAYDNVTRMQPPGSRENNTSQAFQRAEHEHQDEVEERLQPREHEDQDLLQEKLQQREHEHQDALVDRQRPIVDPFALFAIIAAVGLNGTAVLLELGHHTGRDDAVCRRDHCGLLADGPRLERNVPKFARGSHGTLWRAAGLHRIDRSICCRQRVCVRLSAATPG